MEASSATSSMPETLEYEVPAGGAGDYQVKVVSNGGGVTAPYTLAPVTYPVLDHADVSVTLYDPDGEAVRTVRNASGSASFTEPVSGGGDFTVEVENHSPDITAPVSGAWKANSAGVDTWSPSLGAGAVVTRQVTVGDQGSVLADLSWDPDVGGLADVSVTLKDPSGEVVGSSRDADGSVRLAELVSAAGEYTVEVENHSPDRDAVGFATETRYPKALHSKLRLALLDESGTTVAQVVDDDGAASLSTNVTSEEVYEVRVTPEYGSGSASLTGTYPGMPPREEIEYDAHDHATRINDGTFIIDETLAPSGRVLRRKVTERVTGTVTEDVLYGYSGDGDSPAYLKDVATGTVTTYAGGVVYTGTTARYPLADAQGNIHGVTNADGDYTARPDSDEFGVGESPPDRLGWLGAHQRYSVGGASGLMRMGVRLYDPSLGRFLAVDPIESGSCNDYDYVCSDPVGGRDLSGTYGYSYKFDLGALPYSPYQVVAYIVNHFSDVFTFKGCGRRIWTGKRCSLKWGPRRNPIRVYSVGSQSFAFESLKGHGEGAHKRIQFFFNQGRSWAGEKKSHIYMSVWAAGKDNWWQGLPMGNRGNRFLAKHFWKEFAEQIRNTLFYMCCYNPNPEYV
jgi:RHS repeat-associated protein